MTAISPLPPTPRQMAMLRLAADGLRYADIADRLGLSEKTVRNQLAEARDRIGVRSTTQAVWMLRHRLEVME